MVSRGIQCDIPFHPATGSQPELVLVQSEENEGHNLDVDEEFDEPQGCEDPDYNYLADLEQHERDSDEEHRDCSNYNINRYLKNIIF